MRPVQDELDAEEYPVVQPDGSWRWVAAHGRPLYGPDGGLQRIVGSAYDTTRQHDAAAQVRATSELLTLIASASDVLAGSLEPVDVVRNFSRLVVPTLADWSIVTLVEGERPARRRVVAPRPGPARRDGPVRATTASRAATRRPARCSPSARGSRS